MRFLAIGYSRSAGPARRAASALPTRGRLGRLLAQPEALEALAQLFLRGGLERLGDGRAPQARDAAAPKAGCLLEVDQLGLHGLPHLLDGRIAVELAILE